MQKILRHSKIKNDSEVIITGSKSESNRLLLLQALYPEINIKNVSNSDDSDLMQRALDSKSDLIDIHHAGTAMRFLTAFFATQNEREITLTGSQRMQQRPIRVLVEALRKLGAEITYLKNDGFPPLKIKGKELLKNKVSLKADVSSQYISALLLIAPKLKNGMELTLEGEITSIPYIEMTLGLLNQLNIETSFENHIINVKPQREISTITKNLIVESDWSSASYFYSCIALSAEGTSIKLSSYKQNSLQGDSDLVNIYKDFGIETQFIDNEIILKKVENSNLDKIHCHLNNSPDLAQTIAVTCLGLGVSCHLTGLHTLKIKETDRLEALKTEIEKFGTEVTITEEALSIESPQKLKMNISVDTYHDHRMAMAFAPLALVTVLNINDANVVSKSYPDYWNDLIKIGFDIS